MPIQPISSAPVYQPPEAEQVRQAQPAPQAAQPRRIEPAFDEYVPDEQSGKMPRLTPRAEQTTTNTDKVDRELEGLRKKLEDLQAQLRTAAPEQREALERRMAQVQQELAQKDNDGYRRQHAVVN